MTSELHKWQSAQEWTATALDQDHARAWSMFYVTECVLVMILNGVVVLGSVKSDKVHAELLANGNSLLFFMLCVNNFCYGLAQALSRVFFMAAGHVWHEIPCLVNTAINTLFLAASLLYLMAIALEQLISVVLVARVPIERIPQVVVGIYVFAGSWVLAQLLPPGRAVYSAGGEFCYSTATLGWVGVVNVLLVPVNLVTLVGAYVCIFVTLHRAFRRSVSRRSGNATGKPGFPNMGKSMETFVAGKAAHDTIERKPKDEREATVQRKFAIRGALAVLNSCFLFIPVWIAFLKIHVQGQRGSVLLDTVSFCFAFLSAILDPIIGYIQDKRIRAAVAAVGFPSRALSTAQPGSSPSTATTQTATNGNEQGTVSLSRKQSQLRRPLMSVLGNE